MRAVYEKYAEIVLGVLHIVATLTISDVVVDSVIDRLEPWVV